MADQRNADLKQFAASLRRNGYGNIAGQVEDGIGALHERLLDKQKLGGLNPTESACLLEVDTFLRGISAVDWETGSPKASS